MSTITNETEQIETKPIKRKRVKKAVKESYYSQRFLSNTTMIAMSCFVNERRWNIWFGNRFDKVDIHEDVIKSDKRSSIKRLKHSTYKIDVIKRICNESYQALKQGKELKLRYFLNENIGMLNAIHVSTDNYIQVQSCSDTVDLDFRSDNFENVLLTIEDELNKMLLYINENY